MTINLAAKSTRILDCCCTYIPYKDTGYFSPLVIDYLQQKDDLNDFYKFSPDADGIEQAIQLRTTYRVNRDTLVKTLNSQYKGFKLHDKLSTNLQKLSDENTFTICTAHQPNLLTGYLYFIYKIVHAIKLADELNNKYSDKHFVPVYYMGSEDNDLEELGTFKYNGQKFIWNAEEQTGAVGRMNTKSLKPLLDELFRVIGPPGDDTEELKKLLSTAYLKQDNINSATRYLVNELFGKYGLVVLDPDEAAFKTEISDILKDDLLNHNAGKIVAAQIEKLRSYKSQAFPRDINLFYLKDQLRERIEKDGDKWLVLNSDISWSKEELLEELISHPERFSPNVILRGLLQEKILPNVAFIGGGAEVAYWMQLKQLFEHYEVFFPVVLLRQSALWIEPKETELRKMLGLTVKDIFTPIEELKKRHLEKTTNAKWHTDQERNAIEAVFKQLKEKATDLDKTLEASAEAALTKMNKQLAVLEKKMLRAEKRKHDTELQRIEKLIAGTFPGGSLQERYENFIQYYTLYGKEFVATLYNSIEPLQNEFLVISKDN